MLAFQNRMMKYHIVRIGGFGRVVVYTYRLVSDYRECVGGHVILLFSGGSSSCLFPILEITAYSYSYLHVYA